MHGTRKPKSRRVSGLVLALLAGLVLAGCDIALDQTASPGQVRVGEEITYTISGQDLDGDENVFDATPEGAGPIPTEPGQAYSALIGESALPEGAEFVSAQPANTADGSFCAGPDSDRVVRCFLPFIKASENNAVNITVRATEAGEVTNVTTLSDEYLSFATGAEYPVIERTDPATGSPVRVRVDPETGLFLDPDVGNPTTKDLDRSNNTATVTTEVLPADATAPTVKAVSPANRAKNVAPAANVAAVFSESMDPATVNGTTVKLVKRGTRKPVAAVVAYSPAARKVTLNPARPLVRGATYAAAVTAGTKDLAGNALAAPRAWSFTVRR